MKLPARQIVTILVTLGCLIAVLILKQQCGAATAQLFEAVSRPADAGLPHD